ncbi:MAG TPA: hypothetical protein VNA89_01640, partial [Gemmatimonadaceae bacterium]|nr:hypothetical protein [Gemmatimonadaceae bacterium]
MHTSDRDAASFEPGAPDEAGGAGSLGGVVTPLVPPPALEERVVAALTRRGLLARAGRRPGGAGVWRGLGALAAAAALFAAGVL